MDPGGACRADHLGLHAGAPAGGHLAELRLRQQHGQPQRAQLHQLQDRLAAGAGRGQVARVLQPVAQCAVLADARALAGTGSRLPAGTL